MNLNQPLISVLYYNWSCHDVTSVTNAQPTQSGWYQVQVSTSLYGDNLHRLDLVLVSKLKRLILI